jgi:Arc/MetJ-type ribon-helix-helix transcriptional regulator
MIEADQQDILGSRSEIVRCHLRLLTQARSIKGFRYHRIAQLGSTRLFARTETPTTTGRPTRNLTAGCTALLKGSI